MRKGLRGFYSQRRTFLGIFRRFGQKRGYKGRPIGTILILNLSFQDTPYLILTRHVWLNLTKGFHSLSLNTGDIILFDARVDTYLKGYHKDRLDYRLIFPSRIQKVAGAEISNIPLILRYWRGMANKIKRTAELEERLLKEIESRKSSESHLINRFPTIDIKMENDIKIDQSTRTKPFITLEKWFKKALNECQSDN